MKHTQDVVYSMGDLVWPCAPPKKLKKVKKFLQENFGACRVTEQNFPVAYVLEPVLDKDKWKEKNK